MRFHIEMARCDLEIVLLMHRLYRFRFHGNCLNTKTRTVEQGERTGCVARLHALKEALLGRIVRFSDTR